MTVVLSARERKDLLEYASLDPKLAAEGIPLGERLFRFDWNLDAIEDLAEWCAAAANHAENKRIEGRLDKISEKLQDWADSFEEEEA